MAGSQQEEFVDSQMNTVNSNDERDSENLFDKEGEEKTSDPSTTANEPQDKLIKLPLSRIRSIIKTDPDVKIASQDAVVTLAKAAELFIQSLAAEAAARTLREKKKTVLRKHLDTVFDTRDCFSFLEGVLESYES